MTKSMPSDTAWALDGAMSDHEEWSAVWAAGGAARAELPSLLEHGGLLGESTAIVELGRLLTKYAASDSTVLIAGESGTGKELVARVLHDRSQRGKGPFVPVNCAAVPDALLESELFGHVRGAFTNANSDRKGLFQEASGGTLFLDEIAEIQPAMQGKLLRALQEHRIRPVGASDERPVDVRLLVATNKRLETEVSEGRFREDLYYRVNVLLVHVPPLRDRGSDVLVLARHFLPQSAARLGKPVPSLSPDAERALLSHTWPGNVRELQNCIERCVTIAEGNTIEPRDLALPAPTPSEPPAAPPILGGPESCPTLDEVELRYIRQVLHRVGGNKTRAAQLLGIHRRTLLRKLQSRALLGLPGPAK